MTVVLPECVKSISMKAAAAAKRQPGIPDLAKNHRLTSAYTFRPNSRLTSSGSSRERNDPGTSSAASATPAAARSTGHPHAPPATPTQRHQVTLGGFKHHLRAVIEREPHELSHHNTPSQGPPRAIAHSLPSADTRGATGRREQIVTLGRLFHRLTPNSTPPVSVITVRYHLLGPYHFVPPADSSGSRPSRTCSFPRASHP